MESLSQEIRSVATQAGASLVGFAPVSRFETGPEETRPTYYMPEAQSVVSIAIAYPLMPKRVRSPGLICGLVFPISTTNCPMWP
jgi:epoxyqueuosine reductase QueG